MKKSHQQINQNEVIKNKNKSLTVINKTGNKLATMIIKLKDSPNMNMISNSLRDKNRKLIFKKVIIMS